MRAIIIGLLVAEAVAGQDAPPANEPRPDPASALTTNGSYRLPPVTVVGQADPTESIATNLVSARHIQGGGIASPRDLGTLAPNLSVFDGNHERIPKFSVRGLRENNFSAGESTVTVYIDDVPYTDLNSRGLPLHGIDHLDFLPGPQTLYGAGGPGGVLNIVTRQPDRSWHADGAFSLGNYDRQDYLAALYGPLITNHLYLGLSGLYGRRDGFVHNLFLNTHPDTQDTLSGRAQLRWTPTANWDLSFTAAGEQFNDGFVPTFYPAVDPNPFSVSRNFDGYVDTDSLRQSLKIAYENSDLKITSITAHRNWRQNLLQDFDFSPAPIRLGFSQPKLEVWSQEVRLQSPDETQLWKWLGGFFFSDSDGRGESGSIEQAPNPFLPPPPSTFRTRWDSGAQSYALFGQTTYTVWDKLDLSAGLRLTYDDRQLRRSRTLENPFIPPTLLGAAELEDSFTAAQPRFVAAYRFDPAFQPYISIASGYQSGGFNNASDSAVQSKFNPAHSWQYETGIKSDWYDRRLSANLAWFYIETRNYQVYRLSASDPSQASLLNAHRASSTGAELELKARPTRDWELSSALGYTHATFDSFYDPSNAQSFNDNRINFVPQFTANVALQYHSPWHLYARVELEGVGQYELDEANTARQGAYALLNAKMGYAAKYFDISVFGRNLFDRRYFSNALDLRNAFQPDLLVRAPGNPLTFGVALTVNF